MLDLYREVNKMIEKKKRKQMAFDINPEIHRQVKILAAKRNISINLFVQRALIREITRQQKYDESTDLEE